MGLSSLQDDLGGRDSNEIAPYEDPSPRGLRSDCGPLSPALQDGGAPGREGKRHRQKNSCDGCRHDVPSDSHAHLRSERWCAQPPADVLMESLKNPEMRSRRHALGDRSFSAPEREGALALQVLEPSGHRVGTTLRRGAECPSRACRRRCRSARRGWGATFPDFDRSACVGADRSLEGLGEFVLLGPSFPPLIWNDPVKSARW